MRDKVGLADKVGNVSCACLEAARLACVLPQSGVYSFYYYYPYRMRGGVALLR